MMPEGLFYMLAHHELGVICDIYENQNGAMVLVRSGILECEADAEQYGKDHGATSLMDKAPDDGSVSGCCCDSCIMALRMAAGR
jgi:hypothetical protein